MTAAFSHHICDKQNAAAAAATAAGLPLCRPMAERACREVAQPGRKGGSVAGVGTLSSF